MTKGLQERGYCASCRKEVAINKDGTVRKHRDQRHPNDPWDCKGVGYDPGPPPSGTQTPQAAETASPAAPEAPTMVECVLTVVAIVRVPTGTVLAEERQDLYDDPNHLYQTLCAVENDDFTLRLTKRQ